MTPHFSTVAIIGGGLSVTPLFPPASQAQTLLDMSTNSLLGSNSSHHFPNPRRQNHNLREPTESLHPTGNHRSHPNSLRILDRLGVLSTIKARGFSHTQFHIVKKDGSVIGKMVMGSEERYGYPAMRAYRDKLRSALL
jgi:hypothetical protein